MKTQFPAAWIGKEYRKHRENYLINRDKIKRQDVYKRYITKNKNDMNNEIKLLFSCPSLECKGYVNDTGNCLSCKKIFCVECETEKGEEHECDKSLLETVKYKRTTTRPCPTCHVSIHKLNGCDQMWCTQCHTTFCYRTGKIEKGGIHNPEYYRWIRENGGTVPRAQGDDPNRICNRDIMGFFYHKISMIKKHPLKGCEIDAYKLFRFVLEYQTNTNNYGEYQKKWIPKGSANLQTYEIETREKLTLKNILDDNYTEDRWKRDLINLDRYIYRQKFVSDVVENFGLIVTEICAEYMKTNNTESLGQHLSSILNYTNNRLIEFKKMYKGDIPKIVNTGKKFKFLLFSVVN